MMTADIKMIATLALSPLMILLVHMLLARLDRRSSRQVTALSAALLGYVPMAFLLRVSVFSSFDTASDLWSAAYCFIVYSCFAYTYFHFFNMSETARRIKIIYEVYRAGRMTPSEFEAMYSTTDIVGARLKRLLETKQIKFMDGYYSVDGKLLLWAAIFIYMWRKIIGLKGIDRRISQIDADNF